MILFILSLFAVFVLGGSVFLIGIGLFALLCEAGSKVGNKLDEDDY